MGLGALVSANHKSKKGVSKDLHELVLNFKDQTNDLIQEDLIN